MMNYEVFKEIVVEKFKDYLSPEYKDLKLTVSEVNKVNKNLDALSLYDSSGKQNISPMIYINDMYESYCRNEDLQTVLEGYATQMNKGLRDSSKIANINIEDAKDNIVFQLVNTLQNEELLKEVPHREFEDLSIIYRWVISLDESGIRSSVITNDFTKKLGMDENGLYRCAAENTKRILPPTVKSMNEVIREMFEKDGMGEMAEIVLDGVPDTMWVISNSKGVNGASSMLYDDTLHKLASDIEDDLYLLPSSVHEFIAVPAELGEPNELAEMVNEINMDQVSLEERLSNQVYHYDKDTRKLTLATDTPNKRLDGIVAGSNPIYEAGRLR